MNLLSAAALEQIETSPAREFIRAYNPTHNLIGIDFSKGESKTIPVNYASLITDNIIQTNENTTS